MSNNIKWKSNFTFLMAMIGSAIGLGNIWRFPYIFYTGGQGSFLVPYIVAIAVLGFPFLLLEYSVGFKYKISLIEVFKSFNKKYTYVAWALFVAIFLILSYYMCILGWDLNYLFLSFTQGWGSDPNYFFTNSFLNSSTSIYTLFNFVPLILIAVIVLWLISWFISHRGLNSGVGNFSMVVVPLLFFLVIFLLIYALTLPGSFMGVMKFFTPDWSKLLDLNIWLLAFGQIVYSLSLGMAIVLTFASYLPDDTNMSKNALTTICANCGFEIINTIAIFAILGFMAFTTAIPFDSIVTEGTGMVFVVFPQVFNLMGESSLIIGPLFFFMILIAGISSALGLMEALSSYLTGMLNLSRKRAVTILLISGLLVSSLFTSQFGNSLIKIVDSFINNIALLFLIAVECIILTHKQPIEELMEVLNRKTVIPIGNWWKYLVKYIIPIIIAVLLVQGIYDTIFSGDLVLLMLYCCLVVIFFAVPGILYYISNKKEVVYEN